MKFPHWIGGVAMAAATLAGCHSLPALQYYALDPVHPSAAARAPASALLVHVRHVGVPHEMDHLGLTHHVSPTQLAISDNDQWTASLNVLIQGTLTRDLGERLGYDHVVATDALPVVSRPDPGGTAAAPQTTLDLDFVALSADERCGITAQVNWSWSVPTGATRHGTAQLSAPATGCPNGLPTALSTALGDLADQLALQLATP
jgi:uncharacterized lipoprotein YmbA